MSDDWRPIDDGTPIIGNMDRKPRRSCLELAGLAGDRLKASGFQVVTVSLKSEAVYFRFPGRHGVVRVACHPWHGEKIGMNRVVATLTFRGGRHQRDTLYCDEMRFDQLLWTAIGQYMERSVEPLDSLYRGKRGTWEDAATIQS